MPGGVGGVTGAILSPPPDFAVDGPWSEMAKVLEYPQAKTVQEVIDHARWLVESYHAMCSRLQEQVQKHKLGLGGEKIDMLVCEALDAALSARLYGCGPACASRREARHG